MTNMIIIQNISKTNFNYGYCSADSRIKFIRFTSAYTVSVQDV